MNNRELILNNESLDLFDEELIAITFQSNNPIQIDTFQSSYTINFKIPNTPKNRRVFEFADDINVLTSFPYLFQDCIYRQNGNDIFPFALLFVNSYESDFEGQDYFEVQIINGVKGLFETWGELGFNTIPDGVVSKVYATLNRIENYQISLDTFSTRVDRSMESLYVKSLLDYILTENGFTYNFPFGTPNLPNYNRLLLPYTGGVLPILNEEGKKDSGTINFDGTITPQSISGGSNIVGFQFNRVLQPQYNTVNNTFQGGTLGVDAVWAGSGYVRARISIVYDFLTTSTAGRPLLTFKIRKDNPTPVYYDILGDFRVRTIRLFNTPSGNNIQETLEVDIQTTTLDAGTNSVLIPVIDSVFSSAYTINIVGLEFTVEKIDNDILQYGLEPKHFSLSKKEFFKNFCYVYGMMLEQDLYTKQVNIIPFDILLDTTRALDFSDKLDVSKPIKYTYIYDTFAQKNIIAPKKDYSNTDYTTFVNDYEGAIICENELLELQKNILNLIFAFSLENFPSSSVLSNVYIPQFRLDTFVVDRNLQADPRLSIYSNKEAETILVSYTQNNTEDAGQNVLSYTDNTPLYSVDKRTTLEQLSPYAIVENHYNMYGAILDNVKSVECYLLINENDIKTFSKPVYIDYFKSYFYLAKVEQWIDSTETVKCTLYRINQSESFNVGNGLLFNGTTHYCVKQNAIAQYDKNLVSFFFKTDVSLWSGGTQKYLYFAGNSNTNNVYIELELLLGNVYINCVENEGGLQNKFTILLSDTSNIIHFAWRREGVLAIENKTYLNGIEVVNTPTTNLVNQINLFDTGLDVSEYFGSDYLLNVNLFDGIIYDCKFFRDSTLITDNEINDLYRYKGMYLPENMDTSELYDYRFEEIQGEFVYNCNHITGESNFQLKNYTLAQKKIGASNTHRDLNGNAITIIR